MPKVNSDVLSVIKSRSGVYPDGFSDPEIQTYVDEALPVLLSYCNALPSSATAIPDALLYAWVEIASVLIWKSYCIVNGAESSIKEGDSQIQFAKGKIDGTRIVYSQLDNIRVMDQYRTLF